MAFEYNRILGIREGERLRGRSPLAHTRTCRRFADPMSATGARRAPGSGGHPLGRAGCAFEAGMPRLVGVVIATRYPFESTSYINRIDPLLPILEALHAAQQSGIRVPQVQ